MTAASGTSVPRLGPDLQPLSLAFAVFTVVTPGPRYRDRFAPLVNFISPSELRAFRPALAAADPFEMDR